MIHLPYTRNLNQPIPSTTPFNQNLRPYPLYRDITFVDTGGNQSIQSLQLQWTRRMTGGLTLDSHYTWSKNLTDSHDFSPLGGLIQDAYNRRAERGNEESNPRHRWVTQLVYELPFGKGRPYLSDSNKVVQALVGGWITSIPSYSPPVDGTPRSLRARTHRTPTSPVVVRIVPATATKPIQPRKAGLTRLVSVVLPLESGDLGPPG